MAIHGKDGSVAGAGFTAGIHTWGLDYVGDVADDTDFAAANTDEFRTFISGLKSWSGVINCYVEAGAVATWPVPGSEITLQLNFDGAHHLDGDAIITGWSPGVPVGDIETIDISFQGTGPLDVT